MSEVTATVGPESKPEPYKTFYVVQERGLASPSASSDRYDMARGIADCTPGSRVVTIPGDDTITPSPWKPASEPPDSARNVAVRVKGHPRITVGWRLSGGGWEVLYTQGVMQEAPENIEGWAELPPPPEAAR